MTERIPLETFSSGMVNWRFQSQHTREEYLLVNVTLPHCGGSFRLVMVMALVLVLVLTSTSSSMLKFNGMRNCGFGWLLVIVLLLLLLAMETAIRHAIEHHRSVVVVVVVVRSEFIIV